MNEAKPEPKPELIVDFTQLSRADLPRVGGKGANLGEMTQAGMPVPEGFCVTTAGFELFVAPLDEARALMLEADGLEASDLDAIRRVGEALRASLHASPVPAEVTEAIRDALAPYASDQAWAVRSSATLEDLAEASFAGQQDTYLNIRGEQALLDRVRACWASLFTDRAISYRLQHGFGSSSVKLSVVIQRMIPAGLSGIMFTADPLSGHRGVASIDASYGLGEALVSGIVDADNYRMDKRSGELLEHRVGAKATQIRPTSTGTEQVEVEDNLRAQRSLDDAQLAKLVELARKVEAHYGEPQDIEWCIEGEALYLVQSRPITTLYPIPSPILAGEPPDAGKHVYVSFSHAQVMTAPIRPLGIDTIAYVLPVGKPTPEARSEVVRAAAGRIYVNASAAMLRKVLRKRLPQFMTVADPLMSRMLELVVQQPGFLAEDGREAAKLPRFARQIALPVGLRLARNMLWRNPDRNRREAEAFVEARPRQWKAELDAAHEPLDKLATLRRLEASILLELFPRMMHIIVAGILSWRLLRKRFADDPRIEDLTRGLDGNVTTQMDLELADIADIARRHGPLAERLHERPEALLDPASLAGLEGTDELLRAWTRFLERYGHRAAGEIDITTTRWRDDPAGLLQSISGMLTTHEIGGHRRQHDEAARQSERTAAALVAEAGFARRWWVRRLIHRMRVGLSLREHPKFMLMRCLDLARIALVEIAEGLVQQGRLAAADDLWWLNYDEIEAALRGETFTQLIAERRQRYSGYAQLRPPRVITSWGEIPRLPRDPNLPANAHAGIPASGGTVEGIARVILDPNTEMLHDGEVLIAPFTDPGWTPLFIHASALVMEVGGLMTHGSVVAREYGIPAVVGLDDATRIIKTGDRVRVDGDTGVVTVLD